MNEISRKPAHTVTELASARQHQEKSSFFKTRPTIMERAVEGISRIADGTELALRSSVLLLFCRGCMPWPVHVARASLTPKTPPIYGSCVALRGVKTFFSVFFSGVEYGPKYAIFFGRGRGVFRVFRSVFPYWRRSGQINGHLRKKRHRRCALKQRRPSKRSSQADSQAAFRSGG